MGMGSIPAWRRSRRTLAASVPDGAKLDDEASVKLASSFEPMSRLGSCCIPDSRSGSL